MKWYNPLKEPFKISGFAFCEIDGIYRRMPVNPEYELPEAVYNLANETSGGQIRFHAKFKTLKIAVSLGAKPPHFSNEKFPHLSLTNKAGFDIYFSDGGDFKFFGVSKDYDENDRYYEYTFIDNKTQLELDCLLNFPLYGSVDKVLIGFDDDAVISAPEKQFSDSRNLVFYGGSIEQGACASRPGMNESNILSRWLNMEVFNLGFNGSGKAEDEVAKVISSVGNTAAFIISTEGNCPDGEWVYKHLKKFISIYRKKHLDTPIIIMPFAKNYPEDLIYKIGKSKSEKKAAQEKIVTEFKENGDKNIYLFNQDEYVEKEFDGNSLWHEYTVDGTHKTDLAYVATAKGLYRFIKGLI